MSTETRGRVEAIAEDLFEVVTQVCLSTQRHQRRHDDLKEIEFLTLSTLHVQGKRTVGELQRTLGVLPAQMSRIIRSLEDRPRPLVRCQINPQDKRRVDVQLTPAGRQALHTYQAPRIERITELLQTVTENDQEELGRLLNILQLLLDNSSEPVLENDEQEE